MSTITIERFPAAGGASTTKTLAEWGLAVGSTESAAWTIGTLTLTARGESPAFADPVFDYLDVLKVFEDGVCIWWGPVISTGSTVQPAQQRTYTVADPLWWAQWQPFTWPFSPEPEEIDVQRGSWWLGWALGQIAAAYPLAYVFDDFAAFSAPCPDLRASATCLELIQRVARLHPMSAQWWDLSGATPVLRCALRSGLAAVDLARSRCQEPIQLTPLHDQQLTGVRVEYRFTNSFGQRSSVVDDAGTGPFEGANKILCALKVGTDSAADGAANYDAAYDAAAYNIAALIYAARSALPWAGTLTVVGTPSLALPAIRPGQLLNLTGGRTEWASMAAQVQRVSRTIGEACERMEIELGCGDHIGPTDLLSLARAGGVSGGAAGGNPGPYDPPTPPTDDPGGDPGTYDDLNGGTGGGAPTGSIAVQSRGGSWILVGFSALDGTEPLRRWRTQTWSGTKCLSGSARSEMMFPESCCQDARISAKKWVLSGADTYSATTGAYTEGATVALYDGSDGGGTCDTVALTYTSHPTALPVAAHDIHTISATVETRVGYGCTGYLDGHVPDNPGCVNSWWDTCDGTVTRTLADEDLPPDAIGRMLATAEWGEATTAIRTVPTTGITGMYRELRYRTEHTAGDPAVTSPTLIGLSPWQRYQVTVTLESRPVDSAGAPTGDGSWSAAGTRQHYFIADITGEGGIDWQVVEPTAGYETRVASTLVEVA